MQVEMWMIYVLIAIIGWGFGDFFIQRCTRKYGDWEPLFAITLFGVVVLFPFVYKDFPEVFSFSKSLAVLVAASVVLFFAAILDFEALKRGKIAIVEPIWSLEIPVSALLAFFVLQESISIIQVILIVSLIIGLVLVSLRTTHFSHRILLEKGAFIALIAAIMMGAANFFIGWGARITNPLLVNWFVNIVIALGCLIFLAEKHRLKRLVKDIKANKKLWLAMCVFDNAAWIAFAFALSLIPMGITIALSDSYIVIAVLLGLIINKEKLKSHQIIGMVIAIISALVLAYTLG